MQTASTAIESICVHRPPASILRRAGLRKGTNEIACDHWERAQQGFRLRAGPSGCTSAGDTVEETIQGIRESTECRLEVIRRREVWLANLEPTRGSEQAETGRTLVYQSDIVTRFIRTVIKIPFAGNLRRVVTHLSRGEHR